MSDALAPEATEIKFSPAASTRIRATPVAAVGSRQDQVGVDSLAAIIVDRLVAQRILSYLGYQGHFGSQAAAGDRLIGSFAARHHDKLAADHGLSRGSAAARS